MRKLYGIIAVVSILVRQFVLPNPFEPLGETFTLSIKDFSISLTPAVANLIAEPALHAIAFAVVGIYYSRENHEPAFGSFLYLLFYLIHIGLIYIISSFGFTPVAIVIILVVYVIAHISVNALINKFSY
ncbi:MAG: hypothetical protein E7521_01930 [Ruminococcaceae bacterium]|nr:hypothetical protein [Oscillospiraceae bacterium]